MFQLVTAAARSYDRREIARATYQCHSIILAVALVHELQHLYRMHLVPVRLYLPPKMGRVH